MPTSTTLQLKISATKKRLSEDFLASSAMSSIALFGLLASVAIVIRVVTTGSNYGVVPLQIPIISVPINDASTAGFREQPLKSIEKTTLTVALTPSEFIFGDLSAFTMTHTNIRAKFAVPHQEGSPQVLQLVEQISAWQDERTRRLSIRPDRSLLLLPDSRVPMNIVIQVVKLLRNTKQFDDVILAGGLI
jgi:hypothetical protein